MLDKMNRKTILNILQQHAGQLKEHFKLERLSLFGSAARDELSAQSDIDILVSFKGSPTFDGYMDLKFRLEELLGTKVDLVTLKQIKPRMLPIIQKDLIDAA